MKQYKEILLDIVSNGTEKPAARENMPGTLSLFGKQMDEIDLQKGFPLLTTKEINFNHIVVELLWFLKGDTNIKYLLDNGVNIWNQDAYSYYLKVLKDVTDGLVSPMDYKEFVDIVKNRPEALETPWFQSSDYILGSCGQQYGAQWRNFNGKTDQIKDLIAGLRNNPAGRRHIVSAWNPSELEDLALHPCHTMFQFNCRPLSYKERAGIYIERWDGRVDTQEVKDDIALDKRGIPRYYLDCKMYQRSADTFLGVPYNIASYALLTHIVAEMCNMIPSKFTHTFGDLHIYENHIYQVKEQLSRIPRELPKLEIHSDLRDFNVDFSNWFPGMFKLSGYNPQEKIVGKLSTGIKI